MACNESQMKYTDKTLKVIRLCQGFAQKIWNQDDLTIKSTYFDDCGMMMASSGSGPYS